MLMDWDFDEAKHDFIEAYNVVASDDFNSIDDFELIT